MALGSAAIVADVNVPLTQPVIRITGMTMLGGATPSFTLALMYTSLTSL